MEDEEGDGEESSTPFWVKNNTDLRRGVSALFFSSGLVVLLLMVTAVIFLVFIVPKTLSLSAQIFRPNSVKKSWDSLNLVLVLVAIVSGFISRNKNNNEESTSSSSYYDEFQDSPIEQNQAQKHKTYQWPKSDLSTSKQWDGTYSELQSSLMRRNISSYPDLRGFSSIDWSNEDVDRRYYDDIGTGRPLDQGKIHRRHRSLEQVDNLRTVSHNKTVIIDTLLSRYDTAVKVPAADRKSPSPHSASQLPELEKKEQLEYQRVAQKREHSSGKLKKEVEPLTTVAPAMDAAALSTEEEKGSNSGRKRGGATKDFLNSLYHIKKSKKQRQKSVERLEIDSLVSDTQLPMSPTPSSPPKPPSPVLKNIFSLKKHKRKKIITVSLKPSSAAREAKTTSQSPRKTKSSALPQVSSSANRKLPKNKMMNLFGNLDEISNSGEESPLNLIPPAPPPPPPGFLKSPSWKFVVRGDYVRVNSSATSRSDSPEIDDVESNFAGDDTTTPFGGSSPLFYQSPNVDIKAESFISSFRAKLKLEKMHSIKKREVGLSGLGPRAGPNQH